MLYSCVTIPKYSTLFFLMFIHFWERQHEHGRGRERGGQRIQSGLGLTAVSPMQGSNSWTVSLWPEVKSNAQPTEPPRHPFQNIPLYKIHYKDKFWKEEKKYNFLFPHSNKLSCLHPGHIFLRNTYSEPLVRTLSCFVPNYQLVSYISIIWSDGTPSSAN